MYINFVNRTVEFPGLVPVLALIRFKCGANCKFANNLYIFFLASGRMNHLVAE
jgi:hypothetical protein